MSPWHWDDTGSWNASWLKTRTRSCSTVTTTSGGDDPVTQGSRRIIPVLIPWIVLFQHTIKATRKEWNRTLPLLSYRTNFHIRALQLCACFFVCLLFFPGFSHYEFTNVYITTNWAPLPEFIDCELTHYQGGTEQDWLQKVPYKWWIWN